MITISTASLRRALLLGAAGSLFAVNVFALDLDSARAKGLIGERPDGYIAAVTPSPEVNQLVANVNQLRKGEYQKIAARNGQTMDVVEKLAAVKIQERAASGAYFMDASGNWVKK